MGEVREVDGRFVIPNKVRQHSKNRKHQNRGRVLGGTNIGMSKGCEDRGIGIPTMSAPSLGGEVHPVQERHNKSNLFGARRRASPHSCASERWF